MTSTTKTATTLSARDAARTMTLNEYRLWWYEQVGLEPPKEPLSVRQQTDERIIREGYRYRRSYEVPVDSPFCPVNQAQRTTAQPPEHDAGLRDRNPDQRALYDDYAHSRGRMVKHTQTCIAGGKCIQIGESLSNDAQSDTGQPGRDVDTWSVFKWQKRRVLNAEGLLVADTQSDQDAARIVHEHNAHTSLIAALEHTQKFLLLLTDAGVLDQIAAEVSSPDEVNALCDQIDGALKHAREGE